MKFHIHTYGCQMNVRDSEAVEALMLAAGHERAAGEADADVVIVNSCTVRQKAEEKAVGKAGNLIAAKKVTGLMGCAVKRLGADVFKLLPKLDFAVGPRRFGLIPHLIDRVVNGGEHGLLEVGDDEVPTGIDAMEFTSLHELTLFCFSSFNSSSPQCSSPCSPPPIRLKYHSRLPCMASPAFFTPLFLLTLVKIYQKHECSQKLQGAEKKGYSQYTCICWDIINPKPFYIN